MENLNDKNTTKNGWKHVRKYGKTKIHHHKNNDDDVNDNNSRRVMMSVTDFAHRKGIKKGLQSYRDRQKKRHIVTSSALRQYHKIMKQEGYIPGKGRSRKRSHNDNDNDDIIMPTSEYHRNSQIETGREKAEVDDYDTNKGNKETKKSSIDNHTESAANQGSNANNDNNTTNKGKIESNIHNPKAAKYHRYSKSLQKKQQNQVIRQQQQEHQVYNEERKKECYEKRQERRQLIQRKTKRGQPILQNHIHILLDRLMSKSSSSTTQPK